MKGAIANEKDVLYMTSSPFIIKLFVAWLCQSPMKVPMTTDVACDVCLRVCHTHRQSCDILVKSWSWPRRCARTCCFTILLRRSVAVTMLYS